MLENEIYLSDRRSSLCLSRRSVGLVGSFWEVRLRAGSYRGQRRFDHLRSMSVGLSMSFIVNQS